jgi:hypothetical protein
MDSHADFLEDVIQRSREALSNLAKDPVVGPYVDAGLGIPNPFSKGDDVRLIVIGQDPTVKAEATRTAIRTVLNLDKPGTLRTFILKICDRLGLSLDKHVYATNLCKNFFREKPTTLKRTQGVDVLRLSLSYWLPVLRYELEHFPNATVVTHVEPILSLLVHADRPRRMRHYWGHHNDWRNGHLGPLHRVEAADSCLERVFYPFIHQLSSGSSFYSRRFSDYLAFIRRGMLERTE